MEETQGQSRSSGHCCEILLSRDHQGWQTMGKKIMPTFGSSPEMQCVPLSPAAGFFLSFVQVWMKGYSTEICYYKINTDSLVPNGSIDKNKNIFCRWPRNIQKFVLGSAFPEDSCLFWLKWYEWHQNPTYLLRICRLTASYRYFGIDF